MYLDSGVDVVDLLQPLFVDAPSKQLVDAWRLVVQLAVQRLRIRLIEVCKISKHRAC